MSAGTTSSSPQSQPHPSQRSQVSFTPPLNGKYWFAVALVLLALVPDLILSTALSLLSRSIALELKADPSLISIGASFSNAGWAFGAVVAADLFQRFGQRRPLLTYQVMFVIGSVLGAVAPTIWFVLVGHVIQGIATGMLLIAALPPLIRGFPVSRIGVTAAVTGIGLFGAVTLGPLVGGVVATVGAWRLLFGATALLGALGFLIEFLYVEPGAGPNPQFPLDVMGIALAGAGALLTFGGMSALTVFAWTNPLVWAPTVLGLLAIVALIVLEYRKENGLMPVKPLSTTFPIIGIIAAVMSGAAFTGILELLTLYLETARKEPPLTTGLLFWPALIASIGASLLFGAVLRTRFVLILPPVGMLCLIVAAGLLTTISPAGGQWLVLVSALLIGVGAGLTVSPGLFVAGLSVQPNLIGRAFALVEMLRLAGAYALVPAFLHFAQIYGMQPTELTAGVRLIFWVIFGLMLATLAITSVIYYIGRARLHPPDLKVYLEENRQALDSPPLVAKAS